MSLKCNCSSGTSGKTQLFKSDTSPHFIFFKGMAREALGGKTEIQKRDIT